MKSNTLYIGLALLLSFGLGVHKDTIVAQKSIGIGTDKPRTSLEVANGDIYIPDASRGIIMRAPNGKCFKLLMSNKGKTKEYQVLCPGKSPIAVGESPFNITKPSDKFISIQSASTLKKKIKIVLYNWDGNKMDEKITTENRIQLDISIHDPGNYYINIFDENDNKLQYFKFNKKGYF